ncbi:MAG: FmdB family transcriptional regulator [Thermoleophilia bacterium]|nr:FmdB family transcriptional regulator [Thermoleophilia bacterium]
MPTYEYKCEACGHHEEVFAKMSDPPPAACESCGASELVKVLFPVAVHYKGSGFYKTDYEGTKGKPATASTGDGGSASSSSEGSSSSGSDSSSSPSSGSGESSSSSSSGGSSGGSGGGSSSSSND